MKQEYANCTTIKMLNPLLMEKKAIKLYSCMRNLHSLFWKYPTLFLGLLGLGLSIVWNSLRRAGIGLQLTQVGLGQV